MCAAQNTCLHVNRNNCDSYVYRGDGQAFWSVVRSELSWEERRLLLLFITGTDRLPEAGSETLSIEVRATAYLTCRMYPNRHDQESRPFNDKSTRNL